MPQGRTVPCSLPQGFSSQPSPQGSERGLLPWEPKKRRLISELTPFRREVSCEKPQPHVHRGLWGTWKR